MMKHNIFRTCILGAAAALALLASGCSNLFDTKSSDSSASDGKASITFSCGTSARTAQPSVDFTTGYTFTLTGTLNGAETKLFSKISYTSLTTTSTEIDAGLWTFVLTAYNTSDAAVLADTETVELHPGTNAVAFVMSAVSGGTGSVTITLKYPTANGVTKVTAQRYDTPAGADSVGFSGTGLEITLASGSETTDSVTYTESGVPSGNSGWVRFYLYNESGALIGSTTEGVAVVTGLESTSSISLATINTYAAAVTLNKDGNSWTDSGKCVVVRETTDNLAYTLTDSTSSGTFTGSVAAGVYDVYTGTDKDTALASTAAATDKTVGLNSSAVTLLFYSVTCSGTGITFTPATGSASPVLSGGSYSFTAAQNDGYSGTLAVSCGGTALTATDGVYTISSIASKQEVTGTISVTVTFDKNGGTGTMTAQTFAVDTETALTKMTEFTAPDGKYFGGWAAASDATEAAYEDGGKVTLKKDTTLYAVWKLTAVVGMIYYSDGTYSSTYDSAKTPVGIVCEITSGTPASVTKIMGLKEGSSLEWAPSGTTGYTTKFSTSDSAGSGNWAVITAADSTGSATAANYPAFNFANTYGTTNFTSGWYVPAKDELSSLYTNREAINAGISNITNSSLATALNSEVIYWSSSQCSDDYGTAWSVDFSDDSVYNDFKSYGKYVRVIRNVQATHTVTFNANGGTGSDYTQSFADSNATALTAMTGFTAPSGSGKVFGGWSLDSRATTATWADKASATMTGDATLYAVWRYPIVGDIYYSNGTISSSYNSSLVPVGIVCELSGNAVKKIMGLKEISSLKWAPESTTGNTTTFNTSTTDGSGNWAVITKADSTGSTDAATKYPAFNFANTYSTTNFTSGWYVPAKDELLSLYTNMTAINAGISKITNSSLATALNSTVTYWSSSQYSDINSYAWYVNFSYGYVGYYTKIDDDYVRVIRNVQATHTVTFNANGGTGSDYTQSFANNTATALTAMTGFTAPSGKVFGGWSLSSSATAATWADKASVTMTGDATLYAVWRYPIVGDIYYSNGTISSSYNSSLVPVGIVCELSGNAVKKIMGLKEGNGLEWAKSSTTGYNKMFSTSDSDGSGNWAVITAADSTGSATATNYPAFKFANTYSTTNFTSGWYVPAKNELLSLYTNMKAINAGISKITNSSLATALQSEFYWSSSQSSGYYSTAWSVGFSNGTAGTYGKNSAEYVRVIRAF